MAKKTVKRVSKKLAGMGAAPRRKRKMSAKQEANIKRMTKANKECRLKHEPFTKSFGTCMSDWFKKN